MDSEMATRSGAERALAMVTPWAQMKEARSGAAKGPPRESQSGSSWGPQSGQKRASRWGSVKVPKTG